VRVHQKTAEGRGPSFDGLGFARASSKLFLELISMKYDFVQGDRVRVKPGLVAVINRNHTKKIDWIHREGIAVRVGSYNRTTAVLWEGRKSPDPWPTDALEKIH